MSWQKHARIGLVVFVIVFVTIVIVALRQRKGTPAKETASKRLDPVSVSETHGPGLIETYKDGKVNVSVSFRDQITYQDGRTKEKEIVLKLPDRHGRTLTVSANQGERSAKSGQDIGKVLLTGDVKMTTSDGVTVTSNEATYDDDTGMVNVPGPVTFTRARMTGQGIGATYDKTRDVLWLLDQAHVTVKPDAKGQGALEATAGAAGMARADHYIRLTRKGHVTTEGRVIDADEITVKLTEDDERVQMLELRANSHMAGGSDTRGPREMSARDIDLTYGDDGRTLQHAQLMENGVVQFAGEGKNPGRRIAGKTIDIAMAPDGNTVTNLTATEAVQLDLPAEGDLPAKRIRSATLIATGAATEGLQNATFTGNVEYRETRAARGTLPAIDRTATAESLVVNTKPGLGALQQADFHGNVHIKDPPNVEAFAPRVLYHVDRDQMDLSPPGDPGDGPRVSDGRVSVSARIIEFTLGTRKLKADTDVSSSMVPQRGTAARGAQPAQTAARVPSMLKQDQPVNITANRLDYDGAVGHARYTGNAKLWQADTKIYADTIIVDDKSGNLEANGGVRTQTMLDDVDEKTHVKKTVATNGSAETFYYDDAKRLATYTTKANLKGSQGDLTGEKLELFMKEGTNQLSRIEGYGSKGSVVVKDENRTATGDRLTYTEEDKTYVLTGKPVEVIEIVPGDCKKSTGTTLRFVRGSQSIGSLDGSADRAKGVPIPCPVETR
jgi:lipopolysaccharide transport protein LptA/LPS export ABC transporter protein LptC